jgi:hypothetical protein
MQVGEVDQAPHIILGIFIPEHFRAFAYQEKGIDVGYRERYCAYLLLCNLIKHPMNYLKLLCFFSLILLTATACRQGGKEAAKEQAYLDSLQQQVRVLDDSVSRAWSRMIDDDNLKHEYIRRLLLEVSYTNAYDAARSDELNRKLDTLILMRYDRLTMADSPRIDAYDSATFALSADVIAFAMDHPRFRDFPLMQELIDEINQKNDMILLYRIHYDGFAIRRNEIISRDGDRLRARMDNEQLMPTPLFQLPS